MRNSVSSSPKRSKDFPHNNQSFTKKQCSAKCMFFWKYYFYYFCVEHTHDENYAMDYPRFWTKILGILMCGLSKSWLFSDGLKISSTNLKWTWMLSCSREVSSLVLSSKTTTVWGEYLLCQTPDAEHIADYQLEVYNGKLTAVAYRRRANSRNVSF